MLLLLVLALPGLCRGDDGGGVYSVAPPQIFTPVAISSSLFSRTSITSWSLTTLKDSSTKLVGSTVHGSSGFQTSSSHTHVSTSPSSSSSSSPTSQSDLSASTTTNGIVYSTGPESAPNPSVDLTGDEIMDHLRNCTNIWDILNYNDSYVEQHAKGDSDISGVGVILAFLLTAYLTWLGALIAYVMGWIHKRSMGILDEKLLGALRIDLSKGQSDKVQRSIRNAVLICSDQQIITGIGMLIALSTQWKTISVYHYQVAVYLAWMSSNVHLTTLTILRDYLQKNKTLRVWRVGTMLVLMVFLMVALVPMLSRSWAWLTRSSGFAALGPKPHCAASILAKCFLRKDLNHDIDPDTIFSFVILGFMYVWKVCLLFESSERLLNKWLRAKPQYFLEKAIINTAQQHSSSFIYRLCVACYIYFVALADFFESFIASLWILAISILWGTLRVVTPRQQVPEQVRKDEMNIGFGQVLPIFLLLLPFMSISEIVFDTDEDHETEAGHNSERHRSTPKLRVSPMPTPREEVDDPFPRTADPSWYSHIPAFSKRRTRDGHQDVSLMVPNDHEAPRLSRLRSNSATSLVDEETGYELSMMGEHEYCGRDGQLSHNGSSTRLLAADRPPLPKSRPSSSSFTTDSVTATAPKSVHINQPMLFSTYFRTLHLPAFPDYLVKQANDREHHAILYSSRFFKSLFVWFNMFIAGTFGVMVYISATARGDRRHAHISDGDTIYNLTANWKIMGFAVGGMTILIVVWTIVGVRMSRLFR